MNIVKKYIAIIMMAMAFASSSYANKITCVESKDLPSAVEFLISVLGAIPEDQASSLVAKIVKAEDSYTTINNANQLCGAVNNQDENAAFLSSLKFMSQWIDSWGKSPYMSIMMDLAGKDFDMATKLGSVFGTNVYVISNFKISLDVSYPIWWFINGKKSDAEISESISSMSLSYLDNDADYPIDTDFRNSTYQTSPTFDVSNIGAMQIGNMPVIKIKFKNGQKFFIPLSSNYVEANGYGAAAGGITKITIPFVYKDGAYRYSKS